MDCPRDLQSRRFVAAARQAGRRDRMALEGCERLSLPRARLSRQIRLAQSTTWRAAPSAWARVAGLYGSAVVTCYDDRLTLLPWRGQWGRTFDSVPARRSSLQTRCRPNAHTRRFMEEPSAALPRAAA